MIKKYNKEYNKKRNPTIYKLQKLKSYYKRVGQLDKVEAIQIMIDLEKRKLLMGV